MKPARRVLPNIVFENSTIERLAACIASLVDRDGLSQKLDIDQKLLHVTAINAMSDKTTLSLLERWHYTGSTGGLGSFLARFVDNPTVEKVYALNRPLLSSSVERQALAFIDKELFLDLLNFDKLVFIEPASQNKCGLSPAPYELRELVTTTIYNAWRLDFNISLASFEANVKVTGNLADVGLDSCHGSSLRFIFTSSVATAQSWDCERGAFPEEVQLDLSCAVGSGYGEAKYVCERIIAENGLGATSLRIGQISGGPNGSWTTKDWVPILVKSSIALGALPHSHGVVSWMRAEDVASSVLDVAFIPDVPKALSIINPLWRSRPSCKGHGSYALLTTAGG